MHAKGLSKVCWSSHEGTVIMENYPLSVPERLPWRRVNITQSVSFQLKSSIIQDEGRVTIYQEETNEIYRQKFFKISISQESSLAPAKPQHGTYGMFSALLSR